MNQLKIGVFIAYLNDSYQRFLWQYIVQRAGELGITAIGFCGHGLGVPSLAHATMNQAYQLADVHSLDGLVVFASTLGTFHGPQAVLQLLEKQSLPTVSLGFNLPKIPSVFTLGSAAMKELVRHLIVAHKRRSFALVTGPQGHLESWEREQAVRSVLQEFNIALPAELYYTGTFFAESGGAAAKVFLQSGREFDAVVCLNDHMAIGVLDVLRKAGKIVPKDISVTGFDDIEEAAWVSPPLTTVRQPLHEMAHTSLDMIVSLLGGAAMQSRGLDCNLVVRQSCGCPPVLPLATNSAETSRKNSLFRQEIGNLRGSIEKQDLIGVLTVLSHSLARHWGKRSYIQEWREIIIELALDPRLGKFLPAWSDQVLTWLGGEELRWERELRMAQEQRSELIRVFTVRLLGLLQLEAIARHGEDHFEELGIPRGYLILFSDHGALKNGEIPQYARWVSTNQNAERSMATIQFKTRDLAPPQPGFSWGSSGWLVEPLVYQDEFLGYLLLECSTEDQLVFEALRESFSTAVKGAKLIEEVQDHRRRLENKVRLATRDLKIANKDLQEVSNRTMQAIGQDIHDDLCQHLVGISMLGSVLEESMARQKSPGLKAIREIRELVDQAVMRSRQFARTLYPAGLAEHGLGSALEDLIGTMRRTVPGITINLVMEGDSAKIDSVIAYQIYRIIQESLSNALRHSSSDIILVRIVRKDRGFVAEVRDFGKGLSMKSVGSGMGTRIMRHRAETIGANLEIYNLEPGVCVSCSLNLPGGPA